MRARLVLVLIGGFCLACTGTDSAGETCPIDELYESGDGTQYCRDDFAPEDCELLYEELIDAFVTCAEGAFTEEELREEIAAQGVDLDCDAAIATTDDYDVCIDDLREPTCEDRIAQLPEACQGAVLLLE